MVTANKGDALMSCPEAYAEDTLSTLSKPPATLSGSTHNASRDSCR